MSDEDYWRAYGYLPTDEWTGDNVVETDDPYRVPIVLKAPKEEASKTESDGEPMIKYVHPINDPLIFSERTLRFFWKKVERIPFVDCWIWVGALDSYGYGHFFINGRAKPAHRVSYELHYGKRPLLTLDHLCKLRSCVRPDHLEDVTLRENILRSDGFSARRHREIAANQTCLHGHVGQYRIVGGKAYCGACRK